MYLAIIVLYFYFSNSCNLLHYGHAIESPQYTVVHSESDFEQSMVETLQPNPELNVQLVKWKSHCIA
ncbi:hypothetical protein CFP56_025880, partial [Quercus suber]